MRVSTETETECVFSGCISYTVFQNFSVGGWPMATPQTDYCDEQDGHGKRKYTPALCVTTALFLHPRMSDWFVASNDAFQQQMSQGTWMTWEVSWSVSGEGFMLRRLWRMVGMWIGGLPCEDGLHIVSHNFKKLLVHKVKGKSIRVTGRGGP
jgi:hypothetical protein